MILMTKTSLIDDFTMYARALERGILLILMIAVLGIRYWFTDEPLLW